MRKIRNILLVTFVFLIIGTTVFTSILDSKIDRNLKEYSNSNASLFNKLKLLESYAKEYVEANGNTGSVTDLCLAYIRKDTYADQMWSTLLGEVDSNFVAFVQSKDASFNITANDKLIDAKSKVEIDFIHLAATLSVYNMYGTSVNDISTDYGGWAGDLMTVMAEVINYKNTNGITDRNVLKNYANSILGTNKSSTYSVHDALADLDAVNIYATGTLGTDFYNTIVNYYSTSGDNTFFYRYQLIQKKFGTRDGAIATATSLLSNMRAQLVIIPETQVTAEDISLMAELFASYIYEEGYIELSSTSTTNKIGEQVTIPIIHKHTLSATFKSDANIATASISGNNLIINCKGYGKTKIEVVTNGGHTASFEITVVNVPPTITINLPANTEFRAGTDKKIAIAASGTNNVYTWYLSNNGKDNAQLLATTNEPSMTLKTKENMDGKYIICYVRNEGNYEIASSPMKLTMTIEHKTEEPKKEEPKEEDKEEPKEEIKEETKDEPMDEDTSIEEEDKDIVVEIPENNMPKDEPKVNSTKTIILIIIGVFEAVIALSLISVLTKKKNI